MTLVLIFLAFMLCFALLDLVSIPASVRFVVWIINLIMVITCLIKVARVLH